MKQGKLYSPLLAALLCIAPAAHSQVIDVEPGAGNIPAILAEDAAIYAQAMRRGILSIDPVVIQKDGQLVKGKTNRNFVSKTQGNLQKSTMSQMTYEDPTGKSVTVHARSGKPITRTIHNVSATPLSTDGSESPASTSGTDTDGSQVVQHGDVELDAEESRWYPADTDTDVRATILSGENSVIEASAEPTGPSIGRVIHDADAELKSFRKLEQMIQQGDIAEGGRLTGYISKTMCHSCRRAMTEFAEAYRVNGKIYYLNETPAAGDDILVESRKASDELLRLRKAINKSTLAFRATETESIQGGITTNWGRQPYDPVSIAEAERGQLVPNQACIE